MKLNSIILCMGLLIAPLAQAQETPAQETARKLDLRRGVPQDAFMAVHGMHNPERDYQSKYLEEVWQTVQDEKIGERILKIVTSRMPEDQMAGAQKVIDEIHGAIDPSLHASLLSCEESVYAQVFQMPTSYHLVLLRYPPGVAEKLEASCQNLLGLVEKYSEGKVPVSRFNHGDVEITGLALPTEVPFQPAFARIGDVFLISTSQALLSQSIEMLQNGTGVSKFDDPRFAEALSKLPAAEDALTIFDGQQLFKQLRSMGGFIRQQSKDDPGAVRAAEVMELVFDELDIFDYEVSVVYTDGNENRTVALGKLAANADEKLLGKAAMGGEAFENWQEWIPAEAVAYSLSQGIRLHPAYERLMEILETKFPETKPGLEKFAAAQKELDLYLDRDILQSFSGESVSITLPRADNGQDTVFAMKCSNPDRIRALLHRLVDNLKKIPALETQQISLAETEGLAGFESLNVAMLAAFNMKPVIGFHDGWMMIGSNPECLQKVIDARAGKAPTIDGAEHFERFHLPVEGPVHTLSFTDLEKSTRYAADAIRKVGAVAPMFLAMAGANANAEEMKPAMEFLAILPSVANVVEKFDFYQASLTVVQEGPLPDSYLKQSVTLIRPADESKK